jgi:HK97 family phage major capsid protein
MYNPQQRAAIRNDIAWNRLLTNYPLVEAIAGLARESRTGAAAEVHQELSRHQPATQSNSILVPFAALAARAVNVGVANQGGFLVGTENLTAADLLRPRMVTGALGATIISAPHGANINLPKQTAAGTAYWLNNEAATATEAEQTFGQVAFMPKTVAAYTELSRLLKLQSDADQIIARDLAAVLGRAVDKAQLSGNGAAGTLQGIQNVAGVSTFSGDTTGLQTLIDAETSLGDAVGPSTGLATTLAVAGALRKRPELDGSARTLWEGSLVAGTAAGMNARSSTAITSNTLVVGSWEYLALVIWGDLEISVNPYASFKAGVLGIRAFMTCDSAVVWPSAFTIGASFS